MAHHRMIIGVANTRVANLDQNLIRTWLRDGDLLEHEWPSDLLGHLRPLSLGDGHVDEMKMKFEIT